MGVGTEHVEGVGMAEVLVEFDAAFPGPGGARWAPRACARASEDGRWEGWLEFTELNSGDVIRSARETTQPDRDGVAYWATGLTRVYLEGALARALAPTRVRRRPTVHTIPAFDGPAPSVVVDERPLTPHAVLDPFAVYAQGEHVLRQELGALDVDHLRAIVQAYDLGDAAMARTATRGELADRIVHAVERSAR